MGASDDAAWSPVERTAAPQMKLAIVGAGALGSYYGARLALAGADVRFLLRGDLATVRERGLTLREKDATRHLGDVAAFARAEEIGLVDLVVVTMKTTANDLLATLLRPLIGPQTAVLTLQNGLGNEEHLAALVGAERILGAVCYISVTREAPGEMNGYYTPGAMTLGSLAGRRASACAPSPPFSAGLESKRTPSTISPRRAGKN